MVSHSSFLERAVYGRPVDPTVERISARTRARPTAALIGRILLCAIFIASGLGKLMHIDQTAAGIAAAGFPAAKAFAVIAGLAEVLGGLSLLFGFIARVGAAALFVYLIPVTLTFHHFWTFQGADRQMQMINFMKNLAIMGGLLQIFAFGPGHFSVDKKLREPNAP